MNPLFLNDFLFELNTVTGLLCSHYSNLLYPYSTTQTVLRGECEFNELNVDMCVIMSTVRVHN